MTHVILKDDRIIKLTIEPNTGVDVGNLPKGVGLERLRWDGTKLIDLNNLKTFYVDRVTLKLYINPTKDSDKINMSYKDRKHLIFDHTINKVRLKTQIEIDQPKKEEYKARRKSEYPDVNDQIGAIVNYLKTKDDLTPELNEIVNTIQIVKDRWAKSE